MDQGQGNLYQTGELVEEPSGTNETYLAYGHNERKFALETETKKSRGNERKKAKGRLGESYPHRRTGSEKDEVEWRHRGEEIRVVRSSWTLTRLKYLANK